IDVEGHAVVVWSPGIDPRAVGGLASTRTYPLRSSFRPGYNMAINLVGQLGPEDARVMLQRSFAQFQADRSVVGLARRIDHNQHALDGYAESMRCHLGDFGEYATLRGQITDRERALSRRDRSSRRAESAAALEKLHRGDVIVVRSGRRAGLAVVIDPGLAESDDPRPVVVTADRWAGQLTTADFPDPVETLGKLRLPKQVQWRAAKVRRDLASSLRNTGIVAPPRPGKRAGRGAEPDPELAALRRALRAHPCHGCSDREAHARWAERHRRLATDTAVLEQKVASTTNSLAQQFDRIVELLAARGYLDRGRRTTVTAQGEVLARIYSESDLLSTECLRAGVWSSLAPAELAAVASALVFESRRDSPSSPRVPAGSVSAALSATRDVWSILDADEREHRVQRTREPDAGFAWPIYRWSRGESLQKVLQTAESAGQELSAGDFVRWCRQVIDLLDQLKAVLGSTDPVGASAAAAISSIRRGVVAVGTV
ncbi:MAG: DEAD/DEAH box helicase, partial [Sciscionella sp.]